MEEIKSKEDLVKEEILLAARGLFQKFGLKKTSMEEIAEQAGKGKSTLYHYYRNKDELFGTVLEWECNQMKGEICECVIEQETLKGKLKTQFLCKLQAFDKYSVLRGDYAFSLFWIKRMPFLRVIGSVFILI